MRLRTRAARGLRALAGGIFVALLSALLGVPSPRAEGLSIAWQDCREPGGVGFATQTFGCLSTITTLPLFPAFTLASPIDSVWAMELVIDVDVASDLLPAWWHMEPGGCRANGWSADVSLAGSCTDAWDGSGTATFQGWLPGQPGNSSRHGRLLVAVSTLEMVTLADQQPYTACRVLLRTNNPAACEGCEIPACLVFNSLLIRRLPGSSVEEVFLSVAESPGSNMATWQGTGADCQSVPAKRSTWGAVKALYR